MSLSDDRLAMPVRYLPTDPVTPPTDGVALCLSGGGYRAILFHVGVLWRLNEAGWLPTLDRVSCVSGGSVTGGVLAISWPDLAFSEHGVASNFADAVVAPVREFSSHRFDLTSLVGGLVEPFSSAADHLAAAYRRHLFGDSTLQAIPDRPKFIFNSTNLATGELFRFTKDYAADWRVGRVPASSIEVAAAVAASSAIPPVFSPYKVDLADAEWATDPGNDLTTSDYRGELRLADGGVYDNLGLETAWKACRTVLVSDAGAEMEPEPKVPADWARETVRVFQVINNQVRALRKRQVIDGLASGARDGVYLGIRSQVADYHLDDAMPADPARTLQLATAKAHLTGVDPEMQQSLINWGYVIADTGLRRHLDPAAPRGTLPYPDSPLS